MSGAPEAASASQSPNAPELPTNVIVTDAPAATLVVLTVNLGGGSIVNGSADELPPPGVGVCTVTCAVPADARSLAAIDARNCVALTKIVGRGAPFHWTTDEAMNELPFTVSVNAALPAAA